MGSTVLLRRVSSHDFSWSDRPFARLMVGLSEGQSTSLGT